MVRPILAGQPPNHRFKNLKRSVLMALTFAPLRLCVTFSVLGLRLITFLIVIVTKFTEEAWIVFLVIPVLYLFIMAYSGDRKIDLSTE